MFQLIEFMAVLVAAIYGIFHARAARMDVLGVFTVASAVAFGGGTLRDLFLDRHPLFWIANPHYPMIVLGMAIATCMSRRLPRSYTKWLDIPDAIGMGLFSVVGTQFAIESGTSWYIASLMGVITGTFGGVLSDVLCNKVPTLFQSATPLYATCSFAGCWAFLVCQSFAIAEWIPATVGISVVVVSRFVALKWDIRLPDVGDIAEG